jgi:hypothetical protein
MALSRSFRTRNVEAISMEPVTARAPPRTRWLALGDPQTRFDKAIEVLRLHDAIDEATGRLRDDVGLLSIGDHFDFGAEGGPDVGAEGERFLRWLVDHPADQTIVLLGNHDLARVQELAMESDASFAAARTLALEIRAAEDPDDRAEMTTRFHREFPRIPTSEIAARDHSGFATSQRALLQSLLVARRVRLAQAALRDGAPMLLSHACVTDRELDVLQLRDERAPTTIALALDRFLARAVDAVRDRWARGEDAPLDLSPLNVMGTTGREGGGLCYHRPANRARPGADLKWELDAVAPRRFDPRSLPRSLAQACGHTGHHKCLVELEGWTTKRARETGFATLRTLRTNGVEVEYDVGVHAARGGEATVWLIDGEIDRVAAEQLQLFAFDAPLA